MVTISCLECVKAKLFEGDPRAGIPLGLDECLDDTVDQALLDHDQPEPGTPEEFFAARCGRFEPVMLEAACAECGRRIAGARYLHPWWNQDAEPLCSRQCQEKQELKLEVGF